MNPFQTSVISITPEKLRKPEAFRGYINGKLAGYGLNIKISTLYITEQKQVPLTNFQKQTLTYFRPIYHFYNLWFSEVFRAHRNETLG